jgi:N-acetylmuramoyl-L-alanine amidase/CUB domain/Secretion system C-terminal sorting domain
MIRKFILSFAACLFLQNVEAAPAKANPTNPYATYFSEAYSLYPEIPRGLLEAVAFTNTRFYHLTGQEQESCTGMPQAFGVMGLMEDGQGWFNNNLALIDSLSSFTAEEIKTDPRKNILAYAEACHNYKNGILVNGVSTCYRPANLIGITIHSQVILGLSELPSRTEQDQYAINSFLYSIFSFMNEETNAGTYAFPQAKYNLESFFGEENYRVLSSSKVLMSRNEIKDESGNNFRAGDDMNLLSPDYGPAIYTPAASCNYSSRGSIPISAVTIHTVQGTYAGCISWFQNCAAGVSAHYVVRSSDGQVTQMVLEASKAWHVGSENPYTVGIEHEGYVNNAAWYTIAMYTSSAALSLNICNDNGIDELRTGWWPWLHNTYYNQSGIPGSCTKVKGHMHYANQTHSDPGVNWDWDYYYRLINPAPAATMYTAANGNFYDSGGSAGDYLDDERLVWTIAPVSATSVTVSFSSFATENTWDYLFIYDGANTNAPLIGYYTGTANPGTITSSGGSLTFEFRSDCATIGSGWAATWTSNSSNQNSDVTAPTTTVAITGSWQTTNFQSSFTDSDNLGGSGLEKSFYQVIDFDGSDWRANNTQGFFSDNFDLNVINPEWTAATGTWLNANSVLEQNDETNANTNIYAPLTQNLSNKYLYTWAGKIDGTGNNRRAGFHFFSDNGALPNRGNSYFVWFRVDQSVCEFYEVVNDVFTLQNSVPMTTNAGQWYDWKVVYDRTTGKMEVYQDNVFIGSWTDSTPLSNGSYISFRSGNCNWQVNTFKVYRTRISNATIPVSVGNCSSCEIRYQNTNPLTPSGRVKSIVRDSAGNFSSIAYQDVNVDWTVPLPIDTINDGIAMDIDLSFSASVLDANWSASSDPNSGLSAYHYALGTTPGDSDVVAWTYNWGYDTIGLTNLNLLNGQWYYFAVRAENGAGLVTQNYVSDGVFIDLTMGLTIEGANGFTANVGPNPFEQNTTISYSINSSQQVQIQLIDVTGRSIQLVNENKAAGTYSISLNGSDLAQGMYLVRFEVGNAVYSMPVVKKN